MSDVIGAPRQEDQFSDLMGVLRRRKGIVFGGIALGILLAGISIVLTTPSYQVVARVLLTKYGDRNFNPATNPIDRVNNIGQPPEIGGQVSLIQSREVLQAAFQDANVNLPATQEDTGKLLVVTQENTTAVLDVEVNLADPESALRLAVAIPAAYNESVRQKDQAQATTTVNRLKTGQATAQSDLATATAALTNYSAQQGVGGSVAAGDNISEGTERTGRLGNYEQQLKTAQVSVDATQSELQSAIAAQARTPKVVPDPTVRSPIERTLDEQKLIADLRTRLEGAKVTFTDKAPEVRSLEASLRQEEANLKAIPLTISTSATIRNPARDVYDQRVADAQARLAAAQASVAKLTPIVESERKAIDAYQKRLPRQRELEAQVEQKRVALDSAARTLADVLPVAASQTPAVQVVSVTSPLKTQPAIGRTLVAGTFLGIVFGIVAALVRDRLDNRVQTMEQIYDASGAMPIGAVPVSGKPLALGTGAGRNRTLESYRSLRFNLESSGAGGAAVQSVLVASASAGEGRTALSQNLATEAATDLRKTILVDADMRSPELHDRLKLKRGPGLSDVLSGVVSLQDALQPAGENLFFLSAGTEHHNPLELLSGASMAATHEAMKEMADVIVFNSPSLMRYSDGRALARVVDSVVFVAKRGFTRRDAMRYCVGMLRRAQARILGVVLVDERGRTSDVPYFATE